MTTSLKKQSNPSDFFLLGTLSIFSGSPCPMRCEDSSHLTEEPPDSSSAHLNIRTGRILQPQESRTPSHWKQTQETSFLEDTCHHCHPDRWPLWQLQPKTLKWHHSSNLQSDIKYGNGKLLNCCRKGFSH